MDRTDFFISFEKIIHHKRIGYDLNVKRQSACLVINPITVDQELRKIYDQMRTMIHQVDNNIDSKKHGKTRN